MRQLLWSDTEYMVEFPGFEKRGYTFDDGVK